MPENDSFGPPFLDQSAKPLPWTKGGPNESSNLDYPTTTLVNNSVADPVFTIKNRVVTMKDLEELKKRLPVVSKDGRDISDWMKEGHTHVDLKKIIEEAELIQNHSIMNEKNNNRPLGSCVRAVSIEDLIQMKIDPPEYFLEPFLSKSSLGMIYASSGIGKTFFALNLAFALSSGGHFMKFRAPKPCKVLYLDGEMSIYSMKDRIEKIYSSSEVKPIKDHFKLVNSFLQDSPLPNMWSVAEQKKLDELIDSADVIIVIDNRFLICQPRL